MSKFDPFLHIKYASSERLLPSRAFVGLIQAVLERGADFRLKANGMSMYPFILDGDILTMRRIQQNIKIGDVVAAKHPDVGKLVVHRIVARKGVKYQIKGDSNLKEDGLVDKDNILGRIVFIERGTKKIKPGGHTIRRFISFVSRCVCLKRIRFTMYRRILSLGEVF